MKNTKMYSDIIEEIAVVLNCIQLNRSKIIEIADNINAFAPSCVVIAARGTSYNAALCAKYWLEAFCGLPVSISAPSIITKYNGKLNLNRTLVVGISQSGAGLDVCSVIDRANKTGAFTIAITNEEKSPLAISANHSILCGSGKELSVSATKSFASQLSALFMLCAYLSKNRTLIKCIDNLDYSVLMGLQAQDLIISVAENLHSFKSCSVISRGFGLPIALECANKLREVAAIPSSAYSAAEFAHGPIAIANKEHMAILIDLGCKADDEYLTLLKKLERMGCQMLVITKCSSVYRDINCITLDLPKINNEVEGVFSAVPMIQMFACLVSKKQGLDPDNVNGLSKVTITK